MKKKILIVSHPLTLNTAQHEALFATLTAIAEEQGLILVFLAGGEISGFSDCVPVDEVTFTPLNEPRRMRGDFGPELHYATATLDPLEQAIQCAAQVMRDERDAMADLSKRLDQNTLASSLHDRMGRHLDQLLAAQIKRVTANV